MYSGKGVASVGDEHASFSNSSVADGDTLDEPCCAHFSAWRPVLIHSTPLHLEKIALPLLVIFN